MASSIIEKKIAILTPLPPHKTETDKRILYEYFDGINKLNSFGMKIRCFFIQVSRVDWSDVVKKKCGYKYNLINRVERTEKSRCIELAEFRNVLLESSKNFNYALFLDSDVKINSNALTEFLKENLDIQGGVVAIPSNSNTVELGFGIFRNNLNGVFFAKQIPSQIMEVHFVNTACMLLSSKVLNDEQLRFSVYVSPNGTEVSEDMSFCFTAKTLGYHIYVNPKIVCEHLRFFNDKIYELKPSDSGKLIAKVEMVA